MSVRTLWPRGVAVIGLGYIGLPTSAALATRGVRVRGVDLNPFTVAAVNAGKVPIVEPDLDVAVAGAVSRGLLTASTEMPVADVFIIAVPTPFREFHEPDLSFVKSAVSALAPRLTGGELIILESTSPPGTTRQICEWIGEARPDLRLPLSSDSPEVFIAHCPERVLPGRIMVEIVENDRLVGGLTPECTRRAADLYASFCKGEIVSTSSEVAEMAKLVENSFRDVNIAFANELANICQHLDLDVWEVIRLANKHPRVNVLSPGPGVGGHCIAVDPWFLISAAPEHAPLIRSAREVNDSRPSAIVARVQDHASRGSTIAALGLSFKADVDDLRQSPAVAVVAELASRLPTANILAVEPHISELTEGLEKFSNVFLVPLETALEAADVVVMLVNHKQFYDVSPTDLKNKVAIDTRGVWPADSRGVKV